MMSTVMQATPDNAEPVVVQVGVCSTEVSEPVCAMQGVAVRRPILAVPLQAPIGVNANVGILQELLPKLRKVPGQLVSPNRDQWPEVLAGVARHGKRNVAVVMPMQRED